MQFSIIIPVFNRAEKVKPTLDSVLAQTHRPLQVVLVDNFSTDASLQVLQDFAAAHASADFEVKVVQEAERNAPAARNRGYREATGEWVLFFDSDDTMRPTLVEEYRHAIEQHESLDVAVVKAILHSRDGSERPLPYFTTDAFANQILHSILATQRYAVRREFFDRSGLWNTDFYEWNDWELGIRLMLAQPRMAFIDMPLVDIYDSGAASITGTGFFSRAGRWERVIDTVEGYVAASSVAEKARLLRLIDFRRLILAAHYAKEGHQAEARALYTPTRHRLATGIIRRLAIPLLYHLTSKGQRGASRLARHLL
ncbi:MAG: glycosyltransferase family A protein [Bacteroidales bacterium]|nr:glycosyltransferase family A protein [Bacteroidales bacterium]